MPEALDAYSATRLCAWLPPSRALLSPRIEITRGKIIMHRAAIRLEEPSTSNLLMRRHLKSLETDQRPCQLFLALVPGLGPRRAWVL
jgi:hypothetical protein